MTGSTQFVFPPFTLDVVNQCLLRGGEKISLRSKSLAVLSYLVEHPHRLVTKAELIQMAWAGAKVVDAALRVSIQEIRKALGDDPAKPKYVETVGKSGYQFIAPISLKLPERSGGESSTSFVGRDTELEELRDHLKLANGGKRQVVFVTGEPGIGKTALVDVFLSSLTTSERIVVARGQCIEQYGAGEAYMPILDALERLCSGPTGQDAIEALRRYAPAWLINLPALVTPEERAELAHQTMGATAERRLREIAAFLEKLAKSQTIVLVLEDLHWLDPSSLALISFLAHRRETARLMLIGTYREVEIERFNLPLKNIEAELQLHNFCARLSLKLLSQSAVGQYLAARFETETVPQTVLSTVYRRSEGNPLFMVNVTDYLVGRQAIVRKNGSVKLVEPSEREPVPETIRDLIERQCEALPDEDRELLETASVAGMTFPVLLVARLLGRAREAVEQRCRELAEREQFLQYSGSRKRPSGTTSALYGFTHALYQNVIYHRIGEAKRRRLHQSVGERLEQVFHGATEQVAAELALHFERAGDYQRAVRYLVQAAQKASQQSAYQEAIESASRGLALLKSIAPSQSKIELELNLQLVLGVASASTHGYSTDEAKNAFARARAFLGDLANDLLLFHALAGLWSFYLMRAELLSCLELAEQMLNVAGRTGNTLFSIVGHMAVGLANFYLGNLATALKHLNQSSAIDSEKYRTQAHSFGWDPALVVACYKAQALFLLGYADKAQQHVDEALAIVRDGALPIHQAMANGLLGEFKRCTGETDQILRFAEETIKISTEGGFDHWLALGIAEKGWVLIEQNFKEADIYIQDALQRWRSMGARLSLERLLSLHADAYLSMNRLEQALGCIAEALLIVKTTGVLVYVSELYRLKGEVLLRKGKRKAPNATTAQAETCFRQAIHTARRQQAKSLELRATVSLCRLWQKTGKEKQANKTLAKIYNWFTEGFDTPDLKAAKELLDQLP